MPSKTEDVHSCTASLLPCSSRKGQFGQPLDMNVELERTMEQIMHARRLRVDWGICIDIAETVLLGKINYDVDESSRRREGKVALTFNVTRMPRLKLCSRWPHGPTAICTHHHITSLGLRSGSTKQYEQDWRHSTIQFCTRHGHVDAPEQLVNNVYQGKHDDRIRVGQ